MYSELYKESRHHYKWKELSTEIFTKMLTTWTIYVWMTTGLDLEWYVWLPVTRKSGRLEDWRLMRQNTCSQELDLHKRPEKAKSNCSVAEKQGHPPNWCARWKQPARRFLIMILAGVSIVSQLDCKSLAAAAWLLEQDPELLAGVSGLRKRKQKLLAEVPGLCDWD